MTTKEIVENSTMCYIFIMLKDGSAIMDKIKASEAIELYNNSKIKEEKRLASNAILLTLQSDSVKEHVKKMKIKEEIANTKEATVLFAVNANINSIFKALF